MRIAPALFMGWVCLGLDAGLRNGQQIGSTGIAPWFTMPLLVFIALNASNQTALWTAFILGAMIDLTSNRPIDGSGAIAFGPYTLGYVLAGYFAVIMRGVMLRKSRVAVAAMSVVCSVIQGILTVAILLVRSMYIPQSHFSAPSAFLTALGCAAYTGLSGLLVAAILIPMHPWFKFHDASNRRFVLR